MNIELIFRKFENTQILENFFNNVNKKYNVVSKKIIIANLKNREFVYFLIMEIEKIPKKKT
jgi:hypothetical protein